MKLYAWVVKSALFLLGALAVTLFTASAFAEVAQGEDKTLIVFESKHMSEQHKDILFQALRAVMPGTDFVVSENEANYAKNIVRLQCVSCQGQVSNDLELNQKSMSLSDGKLVFFMDAEKRNKWIYNVKINKLEFALRALKKIAQSEILTSTNLGIVPCIQGCMDAALEYSEAKLRYRDFLGKRSALQVNAGSVVHQILKNFIVKKGEWVQLKYATSSGLTIETRARCLQDAEKNESLQAEIEMSGRKKTLDVIAKSSGRVEHVAQ